jgi:hypothetical protein
LSSTEKPPAEGADLAPWRISRAKQNRTKEEKRYDAKHWHGEPMPPERDHESRFPPEPKIRRRRDGRLILPKAPDAPAPDAPNPGKHTPSPVGGVKRQRGKGGGHRTIGGGRLPHIERPVIAHEMALLAVKATKAQESALHSLIVRFMRKLCVRMFEDHDLSADLIGEALDLAPATVTGLRESSHSWQTSVYNAVAIDLMQGMLASPPKYAGVLGTRKTKENRWLFGYVHKTTPDLLRGQEDERRLYSDWHAAFTRDYRKWMTRK